MGFNDFWNNRADAANEFLRTGQARDESILARDKVFTARSNASAARDNALDTGASCVSTSQCPSGWGCVNGTCVQLNNGSSGGSNSPGGGGDCDPDNPESPCNSGGPNSCQQTPQCGDTAEEARDCCGTRCCSFGSASSSRPGIHCFCGECPPWPGCTSFCDSYLKSNGVVGPGCTEGSDGNSCDSCTECDGNVGGECQPAFNTPCWCSGEECNGGNCEKCVTDVDSPDFGECALDPSGCQQCATITNHVCPCGFAFLGQPVLAPITVCKPYGEGGLLPINLAQQEAAKQCDEICNGDGKEDPCKPKTSSSTHCTDTGSGSASCPGGSSQTGTLEVGGESCAFCETADYSDVPDSCKACDCNCHNDCPECQLCGADGKCYPNPVCEATSFRVQVWQYVEEVDRIGCGARAYGRNEWVTVTTTNTPETSLEYRFFTTSGSDGHGPIPTFDICGGSCPGAYTYARLFDADTDTEIGGYAGYLSGCRFSGVDNFFRYQGGRYEVRVVPVYG